jgi:hypothetical protein
MQRVEIYPDDRIDGTIFLTISTKTDAMKKDEIFSLRNICFNLLVLTAVAGRCLNDAASEQTTFSFAYLDPGTGSMIISAIVGVIATIALGIKTAGYKIRNLFRPRKKNSDDTSASK